MGGGTSVIGDTYYFSDASGIIMNVAPEWDMSTESDEKVGNQHHTYHVHMERKIESTSAVPPSVDILVTKLVTRPYQVREFAEQCVKRLLCVRQRILQKHPTYNPHLETVVETLRQNSQFLENGTGYQINIAVVSNSIPVFQVAAISVAPPDSSVCYCLLYTPDPFETENKSNASLMEVKEMVKSFTINKAPVFLEMMPPGYEMTTFRETRWGISIQLPRQWILAKQTQSHADFYVYTSKGYRIDSGIIGVELADEEQKLEEATDPYEEIGQTLIGAPTMRLSSMTSANAPITEQFTVVVRDLRVLDEPSDDCPESPPSPMLSSLVSPTYTDEGHSFEFNTERNEGDPPLHHAFIPHLDVTNPPSFTEQAQDYLSWLRDYYADVANARGFQVADDVPIDQGLLVLNCFTRKNIPVSHVIYVGLQRLYGGGETKIPRKVVYEHGFASKLASCSLIPPVQSEDTPATQSTVDEHDFFTLPVTKIKCHRIWCIHAGRLYSFSFTAPLSVFDAFYSQIGVRIIESLEFL